jgi:hypothetical protein
LALRVGSGQFFYVPDVPIVEFFVDRSELAFHEPDITMIPWGCAENSFGIVLL